MKAIRRPATEIDPMFFIPDGVDELNYTEGNSTGEELVDEVSVDMDVDDYGDPPVDTTETPETPDILAMVTPHSMHTSDTGAEVVDVVFEVEDIAGVTNYEVRVTKI